MIEAAQVRDSLLKNELIIFASDYGKKAIAETWTVRLSKQVKKLDQFKDFENYNIATGGDSLIVDIDPIHILGEFRWTLWLAQKLN